MRKLVWYEKIGLVQENWSGHADCLDKNDSVGFFFFFFFPG